FRPSRWPDVPGLFRTPQGNFNALRSGSFRRQMDLGRQRVANRQIYSTAGAVLDMKTCLVVDDSEVVRKVARCIFENLKFEANEAESGQSALDACAKVIPDAILL